MTEYMGTFFGPLPGGVEPQSDEASALIEELMAAVEAEDYEPIGSAIIDMWSISVTVGDTAHVEWYDAMEELLHLAVKVTNNVDQAQLTRLEIASYDDPMFLPES